MRIAIIDDTPVNLQLIAALTQAASGFRPECFEDPEEGLQWCLDNNPDLIFVDYMMPKIDGCDFIAEIRKAQWLAETPIVMITAADAPDVRRRALELGATEFLAKPIDNAEFKARVKNLCELRRARQLLADRAEHLQDEVEKAVSAIKAREVELLLRLARAVDSRVQGSAAHGERVGHLCSMIAMCLGLDSEEQARYVAAGSTHDLGLLAIPDRILHATEPLQGADLDTYKSHSKAGYDILQGSRNELTMLAAEIALSHHEHYDGSGYPEGIRGEAIPLCSRIACVANDFDEMVSANALTPEEALAQIESYSGKRYDPKVVAAFREMLPAAKAVLTQFPN